jgi:hypothetical protein
VGRVEDAKPEAQACRTHQRCASRVSGCRGIGRAGRAWAEDEDGKQGEGRQVKGSACVGRVYEDHVEDVAAGALGTRGLGGEEAGGFCFAGSHTRHGRPPQRR